MAHLYPFIFILYLIYLLKQWFLPATLRVFRGSWQVNYTFWPTLRRPMRTLLLCHLLRGPFFFSMSPMKLRADRLPIGFPVYQMYLDISRLHHDMVNMSDAYWSSCDFGQLLPFKFAFFETIQKDPTLSEKQSWKHLKPPLRTLLEPI